MKCLLEELSDKENSFQDHHSPRVSYERRCLYEGSNKPIKQKYFANFLLSFQSNMMDTVAASMTDGCKNLLTQLRTNCNGILEHFMSQMLSKLQANLIWKTDINNSESNKTKEQNHYEFFDSTKENDKESGNNCLMMSKMLIFRE